MPLKKSGPYHHGDLQHALIQGSLEFLSHQGLAALSLRALAQKIGVSAAALYRHFPNKTSLLASIASYGFLILTNQLQKAIQQHPKSIKQQLIAMAKVYFKFASKNSGLLRLMYSLDLEKYPELFQAHLLAEKTFFDVLQQGQQQHVIRPGDTFYYATAALAFIHGLSSLFVESKKHFTEHLPGHFNWNTWLEVLSEIIWQGFSAKS